MVRNAELLKTDAMPDARVEYLFYIPNHTQPFSSFSIKISKLFWIIEGVACCRQISTGCLTQNVIFFLNLGKNKK